MNNDEDATLQLLTVDEVASILRVSTVTVRRLIRLRELGTVHVGADASRRRAVRILRSEVARYIRDNTTPHMAWR